MALQERLTLLVEERNRLVEAEQKMRTGGIAQRAAAAGARMLTLLLVLCCIFGDMQYAAFCTLVNASFH